MTSVTNNQLADILYTMAMHPGMTDAQIAVLHDLEERIIEMIRRAVVEALDEQRHRNGRWYVSQRLMRAARAALNARELSAIARASLRGYGGQISTAQTPETAPPSRTDTHGIA